MVRHVTQENPLVPLRTREGKSLIQLSWEAANTVSLGISEIYVATDDKRIEEHAVAFGQRLSELLQNVKTVRRDAQYSRE